MRHLSWICLLATLSACSPKGPDKAVGAGSVPSPSAYEGIYLDKAEAEALRTTGKITDETCKKSLEDGYTVGNTHIINKAGEARGYYPQWNVIEGSVKPTFTINPDDTVTYNSDSVEEMPTNLAIRASLSNGVLTIKANYEGQEFKMEYARSTKEEVLSYFDYQEKHCKNKKD